MHKPSRIVKRHWPGGESLREWAKRLAVSGGGQDEITLACREWLNNKGVTKGND